MNIEGIRVDPQRAFTVVDAALKARETHEGLFGLDIEPPERRFIDLTMQASFLLADAHLPLNAIFLLTTFVFGDDTGRFFQRFSHLDRILEYAWLFQPKEVVRRAQTGENIESSLKSFLRLAGYNNNALWQYFHNCQVLAEQYDGFVGNFFRGKGSDADRIINALVVYPRAKTEKKPGFRRFGPKLARLLVQWVNQYRLYPMENADQIGLPVDFQVARIMIQTGALQIESLTQAHTLQHKVALPLLVQICAETGWNPRIVSETLWAIGHLGCNKRLHTYCPITTLCDRLISREPYDDDGLFDPTDVGRFKT